MMNEPLWAWLDGFRQRAKIVRVVLAVLGLLGVSLSAPRLARANSGHIILETMGISIAVGTVLGASTLPFYDQPGKHLMNLAYSASAGAVTGIGVLVYQWIAGPGREEPSWGFEPNLRLRDPVNVRKTKIVGGRALCASDGTGPAIGRNDFVSPRSGFVSPAQFWMPLVSLNW